MSNSPHDDSDPTIAERSCDDTADGPENTDELIGAVDIVEAFTALRHELKLQVRNGRDLHQALGTGLQRIEQRVASLSSNGTGSASSTDSRRLAEAIAEMEESLQRAREAFSRHSGTTRSQVDPLAQLDAAINNTSWLIRAVSKKFLTALRGIFEQVAIELLDRKTAIDGARQGLELLHERAKRLMDQCEIERFDVSDKPFDAEEMHAVDVVESESIPSSHVAEQLRPGYRWHGKILRYADVRIAK